MIEDLVRENAGVLSAQNLSEFYAIVTHKLPRPLSAFDAAYRVRRFVRIFRILPVTADVVIAAMDAVALYQLSIWDAQIWAAAKLNNIRHILTEDMQHGRVIDGVRYHNPFAPAFDLTLLRV